MCCFRASWAWGCSSSSSALSCGAQPLPGEGRRARVVAQPIAGIQRRHGLQVGCERGRAGFRPVRPEPADAGAELGRPARLGAGQAAHRRRRGNRYSRTVCPCAAGIRTAPAGTGACGHRRNCGVILAPVAQHGPATIILLWPAPLPEAFTRQARARSGKSEHSPIGARSRPAPGRSSRCPGPRSGI